MEGVNKNIAEVGNTTSARETNYINEFCEITFTNGEKYEKFPKTPRPEIRYDGIFPTKEQIKERIKIKLREGFPLLLIIIWTIFITTIIQIV